MGIFEMNFEIFSKYWATPISNAVIVILAILLLYPLIWRLTIKQLSAAFRAIETAKSFPEIITKLEDTSEKIKSIHKDFDLLNEKLKVFDEIKSLIEQLNEGLQNSSRQIADLQLQSESQAISTQIDTKATGNGEIDKWEEISKLRREARDFIESRVSGIRDGRTRRKYPSISRYTFDEISKALFDDSAIDKIQYDSLIQIDKLYLSVRRSKKISDDLVNKFRELGKNINA
jgi:glutamine synthetase adenylyltransferase